MRHRLFAKDTAAAISCARVYERSFAFLDGELEIAEAQLIEAHLLICTDCREEVARCRQSEQALVMAHQAIPPAGDLRTGFYAKLAESGKAPRPGWQLVGVTLACVVLALAALGPILSSHVIGGSEGKSAFIATGMPEISAPTVSFAPNTAIFPSRTRSATSSGGGMTHRMPMRLAEVLQVHGPSFRQRQPLIVRAATRPFQVADARSFPRIEPLSSTHIGVSGSSEAVPSVRNRPARSSRALTDDQTSKPVESSTEIAASSQESETVLHVEDDVRGFTSSTRVASAGENAEGDSVISIDAEDSSTASTVSTPQQ